VSPHLTGLLADALQASLSVASPPRSAALGSDDPMLPLIVSNPQALPGFLTEIATLLQSNTEPSQCMCRAGVNGTHCEFDGRRG